MARSCFKIHDGAPTTTRGHGIGKKKYIYIYNDDHFYFGGVLASHPGI